MRSASNEFDLNVIRPLLRWTSVATLTASVLGGCASIQDAVDRVRDRIDPSSEATPVENDAITPARAPASAEAARPVRVKPRAVNTDLPPSATTVVPKPAPEMESDTIPGPAWLKRCATVQLAGGVLRCDADLLLTKPSATVQVFTRDPGRVVEGQILLRSGLPQLYRLYVVP